MTPAQARDKTDIVVLANGDEITGEIKALSYGKLRLGTDSMGTVHIEWNDIRLLESEYAFEVELSSGDRHFGTLERAETQGRVGIGVAGQSVEVETLRIVRMEAIEDDFWERISGSLSIGFNYTKASDVFQFNIAGSATYRDQDTAITLEGNSVTTRDASDDKTERESLRLQRLVSKGGRWFTIINGALERNDELGLNLRASVGFAGGRYVIQNSRTELTGYGGLQGTRESLAGDARTEENVEAVVGASYRRFIFDDPNVDIAASLRVYPSVTESGRVRSELDGRARYELIEDLFLDLTVYNSYDSDPPSGVDATTDYGVVTSLGWSF